MLGYFIYMQNVYLKIYIKLSAWQIIYLHYYREQYTGIINKIQINKVKTGFLTDQEQTEKICIKSGKFF